MTDGTGQIQIARFGIIPLRSHALEIKDLLAIDDNFDIQADLMRKDERKQMPTKLLMSLMAIVVEGEAKIRVNQSEVVIRKNDILVETPGSIWEGIETMHECKCIFMAFNPENAAAWTPMKSVEDVRKWIGEVPTPFVIHSSQEVTDEVIRIYTTMRDIHKRIDKEYSYDLIAGYVITLFALLATHMKSHPIERSMTANSKHKGMLVKFMNDIHEFCGTERSVSFYADRCCLSPKYFARIIMEASGKKPGDIIKNAVILEAKVLLATNKYSVQQISDKLHFANSSFFCKYFKSATGLSPKNYLAFRKRDGGSE